MTLKYHTNLNTVLAHQHTIDTFENSPEYLYISLMKKLIYLLTILSAPVLANEGVSLGQFDSLMHENKGCPINSDCSKASGEKLQLWEKAIKNINSKNKVKKLEAFRKEHGLPIHFLTNKKAKEALDPVLWNSRCRFHNPKNPSNNILKGLKFFKSMPSSELTVLTPVRLYDGSKKIDYLIPYGDQVFFIKNKQLVILKDYDDFYFQIAISPDKTYNVVNHPSGLINMALDRRVVQFKCPEEMEIDSTYFAKVYCQKILDLDTNDLKIIQYPWTCP